MKITSFLPIETLRPFVSEFKLMRTGQQEAENRVIPSTSPTLAFRFSGQNAYYDGTLKTVLPTSVISGVRRTVRLIHYAKDTSTLIVQFKELGAQIFFRQPLFELFEQSVALNELVDPVQVQIIEELLCNAGSDQERIGIVEAFLLERIRSLRCDMLIYEAVAKINSENGLVRIRHLAGNLYLSNDAFEKRFRAATGTSPKQFASIVRMRSIVKQNPEGRILDLALEAGFYDQAHFNKDFKIFTGQTPTAFYKDAAFW